MSAQPDVQQGHPVLLHGDGYSVVVALALLVSTGVAVLVSTVVAPLGATLA